MCVSLRDHPTVLWVLRGFLCTIKLVVWIGLGLLWCAALALGGAFLAFQMVGLPAPALLNIATLLVVLALGFHLMCGLPPLPRLAQAYIALWRCIRRG
jgi:hypothetical protein